MGEYYFELVHRPGAKHGNADALSRYPVSTVQEKDQLIHPNFKIEFRKNQSKDSIISILLNWMKKGKRPEAEEMEGSGSELCYYWARFEELEIEDNILGIKIAINDGATVQFCAIVPNASKQEILELAHASAAGGHF